MSVRAAPITVGGQLEAALMPSFESGQQDCTSALGWHQAMEEPAIRGRAQGRLRRGPSTPGFVGHWFVRITQPPVKTLFQGEGPADYRTARIVAEQLIDGGPPSVFSGALRGVRIP